MSNDIAMLLADRELSRMERNRLRDALAEALAGWEGWMRQALTGDEDEKDIARIKALHAEFLG